MEEFLRGWKRVLAYVLCITITAGCFSGMALPVNAQRGTNSVNEHSATASGNVITYSECLHENTVEVEDEGTCYEDGYTAGVQCVDCETWISGHEMVEANHVDEDADDVCDRCDKTMPIKIGYCGSGDEDDESYRAVRYYQYVDGELEIFGDGSIACEAFFNFDSLKTVTISGNVKEIGSSAFYNCDNLETVIISEGVTQIGSSAFQSCGALKTVSIPGSVKEIGSSAYAFCKNLETAIISEGVIRIGSSAFLICESLKTVSIPRSVKEIGGDAYNYCYNLEKIEILNPECTISEYASTIYSKAIIYGYESSTAQKYAKRNSRKFVVYCSCENTVEKEGKEATCYEDGYTAGVLCADCEIWISTHEVTEANHMDKGADGVCDRCNKTMPIKTGYCGTGDETDASYRAVRYYQYADGEVEIFGNGTIRNEAFYRNEEIVKVIIYNGITSIEERAFQDCYNMKHVRIPDSVASIGKEVFAYCCSLVTINIPDSITNIDAWTFGGCDALREIIIPESVISIGENAFRSCNSIEEIIIPKSVTNIGQRAFYQCDELEKITILNPECIIYSAWDTMPYDVTIYGYENSTAQSYVKENGHSFLIYCLHENMIEVEGDVTCYKEGYSDGVKCEKCERWISGHNMESAHHTDEENDGICNLCGKTMPTSSGYCGSDYYRDVNFYQYADGELEIFGNGEIDSFSFQYDKYGSGCTNVTIFEGITAIGRGAFRDSDVLKSVNIPSSVKSIKFEAFRDCSSLKTVYISEGLTTIDDQAFLDCASLETVTIPETVTTIGRSVFGGCTSLKKIVIPNSVTSIGVTAILNKVIWCNKGSYAETYAIANDCPYVLIDGGDEENIITEPFGSRFIWSLDKRTGVLEISGSGKMPAGAPWMEYEPYITKISFSKGITEVNLSLFQKLENLEDIYCPSVEDWMNIKFDDSGMYGQLEYAVNLYFDGKLVEDIAIPSGTTVISDYAFANCKNLKRVIIPNGVTNVGDYAFVNCDNLETVILPKGIEHIGAYAFCNCILLKSIDFPHGLKFIDESGFENCVMIESVTIPSSTYQLSYKSFYNCLSLSNVIFELDKYGWSDLSIIGSSVFDGCQISEIEIPANVNYIGSNAFSPTLKKIIIYNPKCKIAPDFGMTCNKEIYGFIGSTAEEIADEIGLFFGDIEEKHEHEYRTVVAYDCCKCERCFCGNERKKDHIDKDKNEICEVCGKSTDALSLTEAIVADIRPNGEVRFSYTTKSSGIYTFKVNGLSECSKVYLYDEAMKELDYAYEENYYVIKEDLQKQEKVYLKILNGEYASHAQISLSLHQHKYIPKIITKGTCIEQEYIEYVCTCGDSYAEYEWIIRHDYKTVLKKATLNANGYVVKRCTLCSEETGRKIFYKPTSMKLSKTKYSYTGGEITPSVTVSDSKGNKLVKDKDYSIKYSSDTRKNTGKYTATITFKGNYSGSKKLTFYILPGKTSKITYTRTTTSVKATWKKVTGASGYKVECLSSKGKVLETKYTSSLSGTFKKLSSGTTYKIRVTAYKTIDKTKYNALSNKVITVATSPKKPTLKVTAGSKSAALSWKKVTGSGYQIVYSTSSKFSSSKTVTVTSSSTLKKTIKNLTKGKTYYFKIRAYKTVEKMKVYGSYSSVVKVKIK